jgi:hypothetical protein
MSDSTDQPMTGSAAIAPSGLWATSAVAGALCLALASNLIDLQRGATALTKLGKEQTDALVVARKGEAQLNALAKGVQQLAVAGNPNAQAIVATLQRNGIQINAK